MTQLALFPYTEKVLGSKAPAGLCGGFIFSLCLHGFSTGPLAYSVVCRCTFSSGNMLACKSLQ